MDKLEWTETPERIPNGQPPAPPHHEGDPTMAPVPDWVRDAPQVLPPEPTLIETPKVP